MSNMDANHPIRISSILIKGNERTKEIYFQNVFLESMHCRNTNELHEHLSTVTQHLRESGLFEGVESNINISSSPSTNRDKQRISSSPYVMNINNDKEGLIEKYDVTIHVTVKEVGIPQLNFKTDIEPGHNVTGNGSLNLSLRNALGYGEVTRLSANQNTSGGQEYSLITSIPHIKVPYIGSLFRNILMPIIQPINNAILGSLFTSKTSPNLIKSSLDVKSTAANDNYLNMRNNPEHVDLGLVQLIFKKSEENNLSHFLSYKSSIQTIAAEYSSQYGTHKINSEFTIRDEIPSSHQPPQSVLSLPLSTPQQILPSGFLLSNLSNSKNNFLPHPHSKNASQEILSSIDSSSKTAVKYTLTKDSRDTNSNSIFGSYFQSSLELAVPTGVKCASYIRTDLTAQINMKMGEVPNSCGNGMVGSISGSLGALWPLPIKNGFQAFLSDRYHLGGPLSLRGFAPYGIGPRAPATSNSGIQNEDQNSEKPNADSLGGIGKSSFLATLSVPLNLKFLAKDSVRAFLFLNAGTLSSGSSSFSRSSTKINNQENENNISNKSCNSNNGKDTNVPLFGHLRASTGAGVAIALAPSVNLEVTYSIPILKASHDVIKPFQLGVGLSIG